LFPFPEEFRLIGEKQFMQCTQQALQAVLYTIIHLLNPNVMKEILFALTLGFTFISAPGGYIYAQNSRIVIEPNLKYNFMPHIRNLASLLNPDLGSTHMLARNEINLRALRDFLWRYDQEDHACWFYTANGGFESYFIRDGFGNRAIYDQKGNWLYSLITYGEDKLPRNTRSLVRSTYFDFDIVVVEEIQMNEGTEFIITMQDQSDIRIVKVNKEGDLEILQELRK
jgi:hypothetical protein